MTVIHGNPVVLDEMLRAIKDWYRLARHEEEWAVYEEGRGNDGGAHRARARCYADTARALRLELETGEWHCSCHLLTDAERRERKLA